MSGLTSAPELVVLYSQPLVHYMDGRAYPVSALDFEAEQECILDSLRKSGKSINVQFAHATPVNVRTFVTLGCRVLHFSGHGSEDSLEFEDNRGAAFPLNPAALNDLISSGGHPGIQFAFVSACHSRRGGEALVAAGVRHVVAVKLETPVYDLAARTFAHALYMSLFSGKTIAQAFAAARSLVRNTPDLIGAADEDEKFLLLPEKGNHDITIFSEAAHGEPSVSMLPSNNRLPHLPEHFVGREIETQGVIEALFESRLVNIVGAPGIGKTALAISCSRYLNERRLNEPFLFKDGVFFVRLRSMTSLDAVRHLIAEAIGIGAANEQELVRQIRDLKCLIVLDNAEDPLRSTGKEFRRFLGDILDAAHGVRILLTARQAVGMVQGVIERTYRLDRLAEWDAAALFVESAGSQWAEKELGPVSLDEMVETLKDHPVIRFLSGHPLATRIMTTLLSHRSLDQLHELIERQAIDSLACRNLPPDEQDETSSLVISLDLSVQFLREQDKDSVRLLGLMGLLPGGMFGEALEAIWGKGWRPHMERLIDAYLVQQTSLGSDVERYSTFPFVTSYAEKYCLTDADRGDFNDRSMSFYGQYIQQLFSMLKTTRANVAHHLFALEEPNFWSCLGPDRPIWSGGTEPTPIRTLATFLPQLLVAVGKPYDGLDSCTLGVLATKRYGDELGTANVYQCQGDIKAHLLDFTGAIGDYERAVSLYRSLGDHYGEATTLEEIGEMKTRTGDLRGAKQAVKSAMRIYKQLGDSTGQANCHQVLGNLYMAQNDSEHSFSEFMRAFNSHLKENAVRGVATDLGYIGRAAAIMGFRVRAVLVFELALRLHAALSDNTGIGLDLGHQGMAFKQLGQYWGALAAFGGAITIFGASGNPWADQISQQLAEVGRHLGVDPYKTFAEASDATLDQWRTKAVHAVQNNFPPDQFVVQLASALEKNPIGLRPID